MIYRKEPRQILLFDRVEEILHPKAHLNIEVDKQHLDSTHVFSNMADWNRSMLLFKTRKRFLVQVKRHESRLYGELDQDGSITKHKAAGFTAMPKHATRVTEIISALTMNSFAGTCCA